MDLLLIHFVVLGWLSIAAASRWADHPTDRMLAAGALAWANLLATTTLLSPFLLLGQSGYFLAASIILAVLTVFAAHRFPAVVGAMPPPDQGNLLFSGLALGSLAALALASGLAAAAYPPLDPTSLTHLLPPAVFAVGEGSIFPQPTDVPYRPLVWFNHGLIQTAAAAYHPPLSTLSFINLIGWVSAGLGVHRISRQWGASAHSALIAAWCALAATPVLAQAATATASLVPAAALLGATSFTVDALRRGRAASAAFAGLLAGLAAGSTPAALAFVTFGLATVVFTRRLPSATWLTVALPALSLGLVPIALTLALRTSPVALPSATVIAELNAPASIGLSTFLPLWRKPAMLYPPTEGDISLGLAGIACILGALTLGLRFRDTPRAPLWLATVALSWFAAVFAARRWHLDSADLVPALLLAAPALALVLDHAMHLRPRLAVGVAGLVAAGTLWSAHLYLRHNAYRPLAPNPDSNAGPTQTPPLPTVFALRLQEADRVNLLTPAPPFALAPLLLSQPAKIYTARPSPVIEALNIRAHPLSTINVPVESIGRAGSSAVLVPFPLKPTAGIEPLGLAGDDPDPCFYFGLQPNAQAESAHELNLYLLVILKPAIEPNVSPGALRIAVQGLHPDDASQLMIYTEDEAGQRHFLGQLTDDTPVIIEPVHAHRGLIFEVVATADLRALSAVTLPYRAALTSAFATPAGSTVAFVHDLMSSPPHSALSTEGLDDPEGPSRALRLPVIRWARQENVVIRVPDAAGAPRIRLELSARLQLRSRGILEVFCNGQLARTIELVGPAQWHDLTVDFPSRPGENVIELRNALLPAGYDWVDYLHRYPDVRRYIELNHGQPAEGARDHYELSGRAEGRTMKLFAPPPPLVAGEHFFMFRRLRVEGHGP